MTREHSPVTKDSAMNESAPRESTLRASAGGSTPRPSVAAQTRAAQTRAAQTRAAQSTAVQSRAVRTMRRGILAAVAAGMIAGSTLIFGAPQQTPPAAPPAPPPPATGQPAAGQPAPQTPTAQTPPQPEPPRQPTIRVGIDFVRVDAIVIDKKGNAVRDLKAEDFEVLEDGKPQKVEQFRLIETNGQPINNETPREIRSDYVLESEAAREDVRLFVIFLDDYHVRRGASMVVKEPLIRFIRNQLGPMDVVGIMYPLTPFKDISFTRNHEGVVRAIEQFEGRKFDYRPRNDLEERYVYYPRETVERIRNQVSLSALEAAVSGLGTLREGRKSLILVSEGYTNYLPPQLRDPSAAYPGMDNPNRNNPMAGDGDLNEDRAAFFSNADLLTEMRDVFNAANRANTAIYALDPRGLGAYEFDINENVGPGLDRAALQQTLDTLRVLSEETDGRAIVNRNDLDVGLKQMMRDASSYYLLGYTSSQAPRDGKFHEIKVRVKRPGIDVRARKGYWAFTAAESAKALAPPSAGPDPAIGQALSAIELPNRARLIRTWIGAQRAENGRTAVTFMWEPVPDVSGGRREPPSTVMVTASGEKSSYFRGRVPETGASTDGGTLVGAGGGSAGGTATVPAPMTAGASAAGGRVTFMATPGTLQLRLAVQGAAGQTLDSDLSEVVVPDFTKTEPMIGAAALIRARTQRDLTLAAANVQAMPTASREFSRTEKLLVRFDAYAPGEVPTTTATLLNRAGTKMSNLAIKAVNGSTSTVQAEVPLASLPAGDFLIEIKVAGAGGEAKQLLGFRVTS